MNAKVCLCIFVTASYTNSWTNYDEIWWYHITHPGLIHRLYLSDCRGRVMYSQLSTKSWKMRLRVIGVGRICLNLTYATNATYATPYDTRLRNHTYIHLCLYNTAFSYKIKSLSMIVRCILCICWFTKVSCFKVIL